MHAPAEPATLAEPTTPITPAFRPARVVLNRTRRWLRGGKRYFDPLAVLEASVSIVSGVLIWMGIWDLLDLYIVPDTLWGKLLMVLFGMIGATTNSRATHSRATHSRVTLTR